jgi:hypothetical protein
MAGPVVSGEEELRQPARRQRTVRRQTVRNPIFFMVFPLSFYYIILV